MLGVVLLLVLNLHVMKHRSVVLDAVVDVDVGIDVLADVVR